MTVKAPTPPVVFSNTFGFVSTDIPVFVPCESVEAYQNDPYWNAFTNIQCDHSGINDIEADGMHIYCTDGRIVVEGATDEVHVFDMMGRKVKGEWGNGEIVFGVLASGVYLVKVGDTPARRVVVIR